MGQKKQSFMEALSEFILPNRSGYVRSVVSSILGVACSIVPYICAGQIITVLIKGETNFRQVIPWLLLALAGYILKVCFSNLSASLSHKATFFTLEAVRKAMVEKWQRIPMGYFQSNTSGNLKTSLVDRIDSMEPILAHMFPEMTANILVPVAILLYLFVLDWRMAFISLIALPVGFVLQMGCMKGFAEKYQEQIRITKKLNTTLVEYVGGIEVIKAFNQSAASYQKFTDAVNENAAFYVNWMHDTQKFMASSRAVMPTVLATVLPFGTMFYLHGSLSAPSFVMIMILALGIIKPLLAVVDYTDNFAMLGTIAGEIRSVLDAPELVRPIQEEKLADTVLTLENVRFGYNADTEVLHGIDLKITPGTVTAFVGLSGSGKSTIAKLIAGYWDVTEGTIKLGGIDTKKIPAGQLSKLIAYVSQDSFLFDDTIRENIRMGNPNADDQQVEKMAKAAGCDDFIRKLPSGYDTKVGESGGQLSGGERQRVAIARAMMKDAPIIILDEATAYADVENESVLQEAISKLVSGKNPSGIPECHPAGQRKTLLVIAHRLSTITDADNIVVVDKGRIIGQGTHSYLLEYCNLYCKMWAANQEAADEKEVAL